MSRVSRKKLAKEVEQEVEEELTTIIASLSDKKEIRIFLDEFLTREEKIMLGKRLLLFILLKERMPSEDIRSVLGFTFPTIRLYKLLLNTKPEAFQKSLERLIRKEKIKELWRKIDRAMAPLELFLNAKSDMKARAKFASGDWYDEK